MKKNLFNTVYRLVTQARNLGFVLLLFVLPITILSEADCAVSINNVEILAVTKNSTRIRWDSPEQHTAVVVYGKDASYGASVSDELLNYFHFVDLPNLSENTTYNFLIKGKDTHNAETISINYTFTTIDQAKMEVKIRAARADGGLPKTYYVKTDGDDAKDGLSKETAWRHPAAAVSRASAGDTIYLLNGTYLDEEIIFTASGIDTNPITLRAYPGAAPILKNTLAYPVFIGINTNEQSYLNITGITVTNYCLDASSKGHGIVASKKSHDIVIDGCTVGDNGFFGIAVSGYHCLVKNSLGYNNDMDNFRISGHNNICENCTAEQRTGMTYKSDYGFGTSGPSYNITFRNCTADGAFGHNFATTSGKLSLDPSPNGVIFDGCKVINGGVGFEIRDQSNNITIKNTVVDTAKNSNGAIYIVHGASNVLVEDVKVTNSLYPFSLDSNCVGTNITFNRCVAVNTTNEYAQTSEPYAFKVSAGNNVSIINCVANTSTGFNNRSTTAIYAGSKTDRTVRNNIISGFTFGYKGSSAINYSCIFNTKSPVSAGTNGLGNLINMDPLFADSAAGDFHLKSQYGRWNGAAWVLDEVSSPCLDAGDPADDYSLESSLNGGRINLGSYGNTVQASRSGFVPNLDVVPPTILNEIPEQKITVYPNPYVQGKNSGGKIIFGNLTSEAIINIYTLSGELLKTIEHDANINSREEWDIAEVNSGIYLYCVNSSQGNKKGKISIVK
ncbi:MAG: T9SS type A sorting domain-containing protein [Elusimicrobiota bacterium]